MNEKQIAEYEHKTRQTPFAELEKALKLMENSKFGGNQQMMDIIKKEIRVRQARTAACTR